MSASEWEKMEDFWDPTGKRYISLANVKFGEIDLPQFKIVIVKYNGHEVNIGRRLDRSGSIDKAIWADDLYLELIGPLPIPSDFSEIPEDATVSRYY